ncbi:MAG TPA: hypothetical protein VHY48_10585 [Acidobacteriaceae bacterium]|nr:hypothetical protein [Acidobacteriaceae bacterium]
MLLSALTLATFLVHGYHPLAEDGGLYVAGVEFTLNRSLFPHFTRFVTEHLRFSIFAPLLAAIIRVTHLSLGIVLLLAYLGSIALTLLAACAILRRVVSSERAQLTGVALFAALWTLPVAATSLMLMDPYVTARSFSTPLSLFAIAFALDPWPFAEGAPHSSHAWRSFIACLATLALAILFHPLMAGYALGLILVIRLLRWPHRLITIPALLLLTLILAAVLQAIAPAEDPNVVVASFSRYYWFLSQWHWYELLGLAGPLLIFAIFLRYKSHLREAGAALCRASLILGPLSVTVALLFAHESYRTHLVARLQPLRCFLPLYAIMVLLLGAALWQLAAHLTARFPSRYLKSLATALPALLIFATALAMFAVQRSEFPSSHHLELPWRAPANPWSQAFAWSRTHTSPNALFALDAHYITLPGEDSQTFRATSERSVLPDFSKDGGEAAITPALADTWAAGVAAQLNLNEEPDAQRFAALTPYRVDWIVLLSNSTTSLRCPYDNGTVKVCRLASTAGR